MEGTEEEVLGGGRKGMKKMEGKEGFRRNRGRRREDKD
jgi:hypothetical protein